jgi:hypothetical protein
MDFHLIAGRAHVEQPNIDENNLTNILRSIEYNEEEKFLLHLVNNYELINVLKEIIKDYLVQYKRIALHKLLNIYLAKSIDTCNLKELQLTLKYIKESRLATALSTSFNLFSKKKITNEECCICIDNFTMFSFVATTRCNHNYHKSCINWWLKKHSNCPACMTSLCD